MTKGRLIAGLCMLCALAATAVAAPSASAAGTTAFTCREAVPSNTGDWNDAHCKEAGVKEKSKYAHVAFANDTTTELTLTNEKTCSETTLRCTTFLKSVSAGVELKLHAEVVHGIGWMENKQTAGGEHYVTGAGVITYSEIEVTKPEKKGCKIKGGEIKTNELKATTELQEMALKFSPKEGTTFATFEVEGCSNAALNHKYEVTGSVKSTSITGATTDFTHADTTAQGTLSLSGQKAGIEGTGTFLGRLNNTQPFTALSVTTTP